MNFRQYLNETSLNTLQNSAIDAFPRTQKRQHAVDEVRIDHINWTPYLGVKTLYVRGLAHNITNGKEYNPSVLFKGVRYHENNDADGLVPLRDNEGQEHLLEQLSFEENDVLLRCNCKDFYWRFNYFDHTDGSLYGRVRAPYQALHNPGSANPREMPGMCKHLMKLMRVLAEARIIQ